jgi:hypothetical protein
MSKRYHCDMCNGLYKQPVVHIKPFILVYALCADCSRKFKKTPATDLSLLKELELILLDHILVKDKKQPCEG